MLNKAGKTVAVLLVLFLLGATGSRYLAKYSQHMADARQNVIAARAVAASAIRVSQAQTEYAASEKARSDSLAIVATTQAQRADKATQAFREAQIVAPDTCAAVVDAAARAIAAEQTAAEKERAARVAVGLAYDSLAAAHAGVKNALAGLSGAAGRLVDATRPSFFQRVLPKLHVGVTAGLDITGRPTAVIGIGAGWGL